MEGRISKLRLDAMRKVMLGPKLYNKCKTTSASTDELNQRLTQLKVDDCIDGTCTVDMFSRLCGLKESQIPLKQADRAALIPSCYKNNTSLCTLRRSNTEDNKYYLDALNDTNNYDPEEAETCTICLDTLADEPPESDEVITLTCKHSFHKDCLKGWLVKNPKCPVCKRDVSRNDQSEAGITMPQVTQRLIGPARLVGPDDDDDDDDDDDNEPLVMPAMQFRNEEQERAREAEFEARLIELRQEFTNILRQRRQALILMRDAIDPTIRAIRNSIGSSLANLQAHADELKNIHENLKGDFVRREGELEGVLDEFQAWERRRYEREHIANDVEADLDERFAQQQEVDQYIQQKRRYREHVDRTVARFQPYLAELPIASAPPHLIALITELNNLERHIEGLLRSMRGMITSAQISIPKYLSIIVHYYYSFVNAYIRYIRSAVTGGVPLLARQHQQYRELLDRLIARKQYLTNFADSLSHTRFIHGLAAE